MPLENKNIPEEQVLDQVLKALSAMAEHHAEQSQNYAFDGMRTKSALHKEAILIFIRKGSHAYVDFCIQFRLTYHTGAKLVMYKPRKK